MTFSDNKKALDQLNSNDRRGLMVKSSQGKMLCINPCGKNVGIVSDNPEQRANALKRFVHEAILQNVPVTLFSSNLAFDAKIFDLFDLSGQATNIFELPNLRQFNQNRSFHDKFDRPHANQKYINLLAVALAELILKRSSIFDILLYEDIVFSMMGTLLESFFGNHRVKKSYQETLETETGIETKENVTLQHFVDFIYKLYLEPNSERNSACWEKYLELIWLTLSTWLYHPSISLIIGNSEVVGPFCRLRKTNALDDSDNLLQTIAVYSAALKRAYITGGVICISDVNFGNPLAKRVLASLIVQGKKLGITIYYSTTPASVFESSEGGTALINTDMVLAGQIDSSYDLVSQSRVVESLQQIILSNNCSHDDQTYYLNYGKKSLSGYYKFVP